MDSPLMAGERTVKAVATWIDEHEPWLILLAVPPLLLSEYLTPLLPVSWSILVLVLASRLVLRRSLRFGGSLDGAVLVVLVMLAVAVTITSNPRMSIPKAATIIAALALFWSLATSLRRWQNVRTASVLLGLSGVGVVGWALVGTEWPASKVLYLSWIYDLLPVLVSGVPRSFRGGFHPNEVGGALVMLLPVVLAALLMVWKQAADGSSLGMGDLWPPVVRRRLPAALCSRGVLLLLLAVTLLAISLVLIMTQSRGAFLGLAGGLLVFAMLRERRIILILLIVAALFVVVDLMRGQGRLARVVAPLVAPGEQFEHNRLAALLESANRLSRLGGGSTTTATGRAEMWGNAVAALRDYPLTGVGLYTFQSVSWANYVYNVVSPAFNMNHAHNTYLQTGVDFGVFGLVAFLLIVLTVLIRGTRLAVWATDPAARWLACGLIGGLIANLVHGLVDSILPLGHKPGVIFWAMAGLVLAAERVVMQPGSSAAPRARRSPGWGAVTLAVVCVLASMWAFSVGPLSSITRLNLGAVALDQARLKEGLSDVERARLLDRAEQWLAQALPYRADTVNLRLGLVESVRGQTNAAQGYWSQTPLALPYLLAQGDARTKLELPRQAKPYFSDALALAPTSSRALYRMGLVARNEGRLDEAVSLLQRALELNTYGDSDEERAKTYGAIASIMGSQGHWGEAVALYRQAEAASASFNEYGALAWALYKRDDNARAAEDYLRQVIRSAPHVLAARVALVNILHAEGRDDEALDLGKQTMKQFPEEVSPVLAVGEIYLAQQAYAQAEEMYRWAITIRPQESYGYAGLGQAMLAQNEVGAAITALKQAVKLAAEQPYYLILLGDAYRMAGDAVNAATAYRQALELDPGDIAAKQRLGSVPK